jgi:hypothetical protein
MIRVSHFLYSTAPACDTSRNGCYDNLRYVPDGQNAHLRGIRATFMSTAIVMIYTKEGFVVAADSYGNRRKGAPSLAEVKIFETRGRGFTLMYGISGAASLIEKNEDGIETDYYKPFYSQVASELAIEPISTLEQYADCFVSQVGIKIVKEIANAKESFSDSPQTLKLQFAGYFQGVPAMAERTLTYSRSGFSVPCKITCSPARFANTLYVGYDELAEGLSQAVDDEFREYRVGGTWGKVWKRDESISLEEAMDAAKKYILACSSEEARKFDREKEKTIGGKLFLATLTPTITWVHKPF